MGVLRNMIRPLALADDLAADVVQEGYLYLLDRWGVLRGTLKAVLWLWTAMLVVYCDVPGAWVDRLSVVVMLSVSLVHACGDREKQASERDVEMRAESVAWRASLLRRALLVPFVLINLVVSASGGVAGYFLPFLLLGLDFYLDCALVRPRRRWL